jgi:FkbM family methyltransferase
MKLNRIIGNGFDDKFIVGIDNIIKYANGKKVYIFGAGSSIEYVIKLFEKHTDFLGILDNDSTKWGRKIKGYAILSPDSVDKEALVIMASSFQTEINRSLINKGFNQNNIMHFPLVEIIKDKHYDQEYIMDNIEEIHNTYNLFHDKLSKKNYDSIMCYRYTGDLSYLENINSPNEQYFPDIIDIGNGEVIYDIGAYNGDTARDFIKIIENKNLKNCQIVCFEPNPNNSQYIKNIKYDKDNVKIHIEQSVVSNCYDTFTFDDNGAETQFSKNEALKNIVKSVDIDTYVKFNNIIPTYIKMDVEGFEKEVIEGSLMTIRTYRPKLAISIYHKPSDIWIIPKIMSKVLDEYNFFIRHHSYSIDDTVLYCIPKGE